MSGLPILHFKLTDNDQKYVSIQLSYFLICDMIIATKQPEVLNMQNSPDTVEMMNDINKIASYFQGEKEELPQIDAPEEFIRQFTAYRIKLQNDETRKMQQLLINCGYPEKNTAHFFYEAWCRMIEHCSKSLTDKEKEYLNWIDSENTKGSYQFIPSENTIRKWLNKSRTPENRLTIYQVAFVLNLTAYLPEDHIESDSNLYLTSVNYLFNKIFGQRYVSKNPDELIFLYCLINDRQSDNRYLNALKMIALFRERSTNERYNHNSLTEQDSSSTNMVMDNGFGMPASMFIQYLLTISSSLEDLQSFIVRQIEKNINVFSGQKNIDAYLRKYRNHGLESFNLFDMAKEQYQYSPKNFANYVIISSELKKNLNYLSRRMELCLAIQSASSFKEIRQRCLQNGISLSIFNYLSSYETFDYLYNCQGTDETIRFFISQIMVSQDAVYPTKFNLFYKKGHNVVYEQLRRSLIISHFFSFWFINPTADFEEYKLEINSILIKNYYMPLYSKNLFDSFFILCSKFNDPLLHYYNICMEIVDYYKTFQEEFLKIKYSDLNTFQLNSKALIYSEDKYDLDPCDKPSVQKAIIE